MIRLDGSDIKISASMIGRNGAAIPSLDGLRAISILLVLSAHLLPLGPKALQLNATAGAMGMSLFFTLSGFLIVKTLQKDTVTEFIVKRMARILPLVYAYLILVSLVYGMSLQSAFGHVTFIINYFPDLMIPTTEHLWSLCVEIHFYGLVALAVALMGRRGLLLVWPLCILITGIRISQGAYIAIPTHLRIDEILIGGCLSTLAFNKIMAKQFSIFVWTSAATCWFICSHPQTEWLQYLRPYAAGFLLVATLHQSPNRLIKILHSRSANYIATISYALYVVHPFTAHGWWNAGAVWERYLLKRPISVAITFAAAHMSTFKWEKRWTAAARAWINSWRRRNSSI